jgi:hypothetical protein
MAECRAPTATFIDPDSQRTNDPLDQVQDGVLPLE